MLWVIVLGSCMFLEKYGNKLFGCGINAYFHLGIGTTVTNLEHGRRHHMMFKFFKYQLA